MRERVRTFVDRHLLPVINGYWEAAEFPFALVPKIAELGVCGPCRVAVTVPGRTICLLRTGTRRLMLD